MERRGELHLGPDGIGIRHDGSQVELVIVYTDPAITTAVLQKTAEFVAGLDARVTLLAVHAVPYPASFASASASHAHLVGELAELAENSPLPISPQVVMT